MNQLSRAIEDQLTTGLPTYRTRPIWNRVRSIGIFPILRRLIQRIDSQCIYVDITKKYDVKVDCRACKKRTETKYIFKKDHRVLKEKNNNNWINN